MGLELKRTTGPLCVRGRIMVADMSADVRRVAGQIFKSEGFSVVECVSGLEVISVAKECRPDVLFLDVNLRKADAGEVVRVLERFEGTRSVVVVLTCPRDIESGRLARLEATGAVLVLVKPLTREGLIGAFREALEESHERKTQFEKPAAKKRATMRPSSVNNSLLIKQLYCPFHETPTSVDGYVLRTRKIQTDTSYFDLPIYKAAVAGADYVDYNLLGVAVCPRCLFASNNPSYFRDPADRKAKSHTYTAATRAAIASAAGERLLYAGKLPEQLFSEDRTLDGAILTYELAIKSGETLFACNRNTLPIELLRLGNYELRLAHLLGQKAANEEACGKRYTAAYKYLAEAFTVLESSPLFKATYQLVALAIALGEDRSAYQYIARLAEIERNPATSREDRAVLDRYLVRCRRIWEDRGDHRFATAPAKSLAAAA